MIANITMERPRSCIDPSARLLTAVIVKAQGDAVYREPRLPSRKKGAYQAVEQALRDKTDARKWVMESSTFALYCKLIGLEPDVTRKKFMRKWKGR